MYHTSWLTARTASGIYEILLTAFWCPRQWWIVLLDVWSYTPIVLSSLQVKICIGGKQVVAHRLLAGRMLTALHGWLLVVLSSPLRQLQGIDPRCSRHGVIIVEAALQNKCLRGALSSKCPCLPGVMKSCTGQSVVSSSSSQLCYRAEILPTCRLIQQET